MGVHVKIDGVAAWDVADLLTVQDAVGVDPSDTFGGTGTVNFAIPTSVEAKSIIGKSFELVDGDRGSVHGVVAGVSGDRAVARVQAHSRLVALVSERTAAPHVGTLETYLTYLFGLCGITTGIVIDGTIADHDVVAVGFRANVWLQVKKFCAAYGVEVALVDGDVTVRPVRTVRAPRLLETDGYRWAIDQSSLAETVEAWFYPVTAVTDALVVSARDMNPVANLAAGEVQEVRLSLPFSLSSVDQPAPADSVAYGYGASSTYAVLDHLDQPVSAAEWTAGGGRVSVEITEDTRGLRVTVVGSQDRIRAPYRLVGVSNIGVEYSSLRVVGSGVRFDRQKYSIGACLDGRATVEVGAEVDNEYLTSWGHAHLVLLGALRRHGGGQRTVTGAAAMPGDYGTLAGARLFDDFDEYRVRSVTVTPSGVDFTAEADTTVGDIDAVWGGHTLGEWDAQWAGGPLGDLDLRPLTPLSGDVVPSEGYGSGVYGGPPVYGG